MVSPAVPTAEHQSYFDPEQARRIVYNPTSYVHYEKATRRLLVRPYDYQLPIVNPELPARFTFASWGTKAGKTTSAILRMASLLWSKKDHRYRWIAPFGYQSGIAKDRLMRLFPRGEFRWEAKWQRFTGPQGSQLTFHSGERPDTLPGDDIDGAVLDEASRLREQVFEITVSTVLATKGWILAISTPHGRNWFYQQCKKGMAGEPGYWYSTFPSTKNPDMDASILAHTKSSLPEFMYREMILAEFISQTATTFPDLAPCATPTLPRNKPVHKRTYVVSVDVGQIRDRNVITVWDALDGALVSWAVAHGRDYTLIADDIRIISKLWNDAAVYIERNGPGLPIIQFLRAQGVNLGLGQNGEPGFTTTGGNKPALVHSWGLALRNKEPMLPTRDMWPDLYTEHENFEYSIAKSGAWTFDAAPGHHDDIVMSCLIGWWAVKQNIMVPRFWKAGKRTTGPGRTRGVKILNPGEQ